eukprot:TRINITY_DN14931_c0_g1_i1.p1 TRINITY_DN14931_c0_g1~~TRINITY_DN14931_c0_g1_i1.p1  ORF type:complete len:365 (-),score=69.31 TRINITY_DN14931_c0_g1_i1:431-1486(-)
MVRLWVGAPMSSNPSLAEMLPPSEAPLLGQATKDNNKGFIRRLAAWKGPHPHVVLAILVGVVGCVWCVEKIVATLQVATLSGKRVSNLPFGVAAGGNLQNLGGSNAAMSIFDIDVESNLIAVLVFAAATIVVVLGGLQRFVERTLHEHLCTVAGLYGRERLGVEMDIDHVGVWLLGGRVVIRKFALRNPQGFESEHLLFVRRITFQLTPRVLLRYLLGGEVEIALARAEGVDVFVEHENDLCSRSNLQALLSHMKETSAGTRNTVEPGDATIRSVKLVVKAASIVRIVVRRLATTRKAGGGEVSGAVLANMADRHFANLNKELGVAETASDMLAAFVQIIVADAVGTLQRF